MLRWKLKEYLDRHGITPYKLWKESGLSRPTVYAMATGKPKSLFFDVATSVIATLTRLTGKPVTPNDLLEVIEEPEPLEDWDAESKAWMDSDLSRLGEVDPYDWGDIDPDSLGAPVVGGRVQS
jgi:hypothetical protein